MEQTTTTLMRKTLWVFFAFYSLASFASDEPAVVPGTAIRSFVLPGGPPPTEPPPARPWLCAAGCTPESITEGHEQHMSETGQKPRPGKRSVTYIDASGNISSKEIDDEK